MADMRRVVIKVGPTVGAAGEAYAYELTPFVAGYVMAVNLDFSQVPVAGTDFDLSPRNEAYGSGPTVLPYIVALTGFVSDRKFVMPRYFTHKPDGTTITYEGTYQVVEPYPVYGVLVAELSETDPGLEAVVTIWIDGKVGC